MVDVTQILSQIEEGDPIADEQLLPLVYEELRQLAAAKLAQEKPGQTLQPTALVHAAYLRLVGHDDNQQWDSRGHFFGAAAEAMRRILIEQARRKKSRKAGSELDRISTCEGKLADSEKSETVLAIDDALTKFENPHPCKAALVKLRYFGG